MNHNQWPEWIRVLRDDIFPRGFLTRPPSRRVQRVRRKKEASVPGFPWRRDGGLHNRRGRDTCSRQPDGAPPAGTTRGLHLDRVMGVGGKTKKTGMSGETRREAMSNALAL